MGNRVGAKGGANRRGSGACSVGMGAGWGGNACVVGISSGKEGSKFGDPREKGECGLSFKVAVGPGPPGSWHRTRLDRKAKHSGPKRFKAFSVPGVCPPGWW